MNFDDLEIHDKKNNRPGSGGSEGSPLITYRVSNSKANGVTRRFHFGGKLFKELNLALQGAFSGYDKENDRVLFFLTQSEESSRARLFTKAKGNKKSKATTSNILEEALLKVGLIENIEGERVVNGAPVAQKLALQPVEAPPGTPSEVDKVFVFVKPSAEQEAEDVNEDDENETEDEEAPKEPVAETTDEDWG